MSQPHETSAAQHAHEKSDAKSRSIAVFEVALIALIAVSMALMAGLFYYFTHRAERADTSRSPLATERVLPPQPNLQANPAADLAKIRAEEDQKLGSYGWVDKELEIVRIPIDRAMEILLEHGYSKPPPPAPEGAQGESQ